jgi:serine/threonine protein kinase
VEIIKQIDHPNVVKVWQIAEDDKYIYMVMEMLKGGDVSKLNGNLSS